MKEDLYRNLQQKMVTLTLAVSLAPLLILGMVLYNQFERYMRKHVFTIHKAHQQRRLRRRVLPAGPQRKASGYPQTRGQDHPQLRPG
jgi:hypothetical protein